MEFATGRKLTWMAAAAVAFLALGESLADASFVLRMTDLDAPDQQVVIDQGAAGDVSESGLVATAPDLGTAYPGTLLYLGPVGSFHVVMTTGMSKPLLGTPVNKRLDTVSLSVSGGEGRLAIELTDTDFEFNRASGTVHLTSSIGGTTDGRVTAQSFADLSNVEFGTAITPGLQGPFEGGFHNKAFSDFDMTVFDIEPGQPFSISQRVVVEHFNRGGSDDTTSFDIMTEVHTPEPSTLVMWGMGLLGTGFFAWPRQRRRPNHPCSRCDG